MSTVKSKKLQVGTDATSSNNFTIYQPSTPDGTLRIGVGNADSPTEVAQFHSSGITMSSGKTITGNIIPATAPAFHAYSTSDTSVSANTWTKLQAQTTRFNIENCYDTSTARFTPNVAGIYMVTLSFVVVNTSTGYFSNTKVYKNGTGLAEISGGGGNGSSWFRNTVSYLIDCNGTTDYIEFYQYQSITNNVAVPQFSGFLVQQT